VRILKNFVVLPLIGVLISSMIIGRIADIFIGPKNYYVYVVGNRKTKSVKAMLQAAAGAEFKDKLGGVTVTTEIRDDSGDPERGINCEGTGRQIRCPTRCGARLQHEH
jgi:hypothetical protein